MKKILMALFMVLVLVGSYAGIRAAVWDDMVASQYMAASYETGRCNKYHAIKSEQELAKQMHALQQMSSKGTVRPICSYDEAACEKAEKMWADYELSRIKFIRHQWGDVFRHFYKYIILQKKDERD